MAVVDGDVLREVWGGDLGYSEADRRLNMGCMSRLGRLGPLTRTSDTDKPSPGSD